MSSLDLRAASEYFIYDGTPSYDFKCLVFPAEVDNTPEKEYDVQSIPGRDGEIILSNRRFTNVPHSYECIIYEDFDFNFANMREFLMSRNGYCRLEDTIHEDEYYHAYITTVETPRGKRRKDIGKFRLTFSRKPQRFLRTGLEKISMISGNTIRTTIFNPTRFPCFPLLHFDGNSLISDGGLTYSFGSSTAGFTTVKVSKITTSTSPIISNGLDVDMELLQAYDGLNHNSYGSYVTYELDSGCKYPYQMIPGANTFSNNSTVQAMGVIEIQPRWYRI